MTETPDFAAMNTGILRARVNGLYDLQKLRIQAGQRIVAVFRSRLNVDDVPEAIPEGAEVEEDSFVDDGDDELTKKKKEDKEGQKILAVLLESYKNITEAMVKETKKGNRTRVGEFKGDDLICHKSELTIIDDYLMLQRDEKSILRQLEENLKRHPIYVQYLEGVKGVGPAMSGVMISYFDPHKAHHRSGFWRYCGLGVMPDGRRQSKHKEHLVERKYRDKAGKVKSKMGITYQPFLKAKLMGVLGPSFLRCASPWRKVYDGVKHRYETNPLCVKGTAKEWSRLHKAGKPCDHLWTPGRIHKAALGQMVKMFLGELWEQWRTIEGLPLTEPYAVAKLGMPPHGKAA